MKGVKLLTIVPGNCLQNFSRGFSNSRVSMQRHYKLLIVGGGTGGCQMVNKFASKLGRGKVAVIEPKEDHYYQPLWTLVGAGVSKLEQSQTKMAKVLPKKCDWIKAKATKFEPERNVVTVATGEEVRYDYLVVATGLQLDYHKIKGLPEGFKTDSSLCSNYDHEYVKKTWPAIQNFKGGNALFSVPNTPIKCVGAAQKIMYLAEETWREKGIRDETNIEFYTSLAVIFGVKKYANSLLKVTNARNMKVNFRMNLIEVKTDTKEAVFLNCDSPTGVTKTVKYDFLHITPPMSSIEPIRESSLADAAGYVDINKDTLQHVKYPNVFALGDCTNAPTSKTAAAAATQGGILEKNLISAMKNQPLTATYNGYTSCPLVTSRKTCILAEFNYDALPLETFPFDQSKERRSMYIVKKDILPLVYWNMATKGLWNGPKFWRKLMHLGRDQPEKE